MIIGKVTGHVWATKKEESLNGTKLMIARRFDKGGPENNKLIVAADVVGAGIGEYVLIVSGSTARMVMGGDSVLIDAVIVGIIDSIEMKED